ncbi:SDR family oxidoreductase [Streptomyces sp. NPDC001514]
MKRTHIVTGATGLVGAALVLELASRFDDDIICLVRPGADGAAGRLTRALASAAHAYRTDPAIIQRALRLVRAVPADLTQPGLGIDAATLTSIAPAVFWHSGALIAFGEAQRRRLFATNTAGTRRAVTLATQLGCEAFNYVSTAFVAGHGQGEISERPITDPMPREFYEASKIAAERIVLNAPLRTRVFRPSGVVGHHTTLACGGPYTGIYGMMRRIAVHRSFRPLLEGGHHPIRLVARPELPANLVPVDHVARDMVDIALSSTQHRIFHLTNPTPPTVGAAVQAIFQQLGISLYELVEDESRLRPADQHLAALLDEFYSGYLTHDHRFRRDHARAALPASRTSDYPMDAELLNRLFGVYYRDELARRYPATRVPAPRSRPDAAETTAGGSGTAAGPSTVTRTAAGG